MLPGTSSSGTDSSVLQKLQLSSLPVDVDIHDEGTHGSVIGPSLGQLQSREESFSLTNVFQNYMHKYSKRGSAKARAMLMKWCIEHSVTRDAVDKLLKMVKQWTDETILDLPMTAKSLIPTFSQFFKKIVMPPGEFYYLGIRENLQIPNTNFFNPAEDVIELTLNIDGVPAFQSGGKGFWPILAYTQTRRVFLIAFYYGIAKPYDANEYLTLLVEEIQSFYDNRNEGDKGQGVRLYRLE